MLQVTEQAGELLSNMLDDADAPEGAATRFVIEDQKIKVGVDQPREGDQTFEHNGRTVLVVDQQVGELLDDKVLSCEDHEGAKSLAIVAA